MPAWQNGRLSHVSPCSLVYIVSAVASPFLGLMVDFVGYNVHWVNLGTILTLASHTLFAFTSVTPIFVAVSAPVFPTPPPIQQHLSYVVWDAENDDVLTTFVML